MYFDTITVEINNSGLHTVITLILLFFKSDKDFPASVLSWETI